MLNFNFLNGAAHLTGILKFPPLGPRTQHYPVLGLPHFLHFLIFLSLIVQCRHFKRLCCHPSAFSPFCFLLLRSHSSPGLPVVSSKAVKNFQLSILPCFPNRSYIFNAFWPFPLNHNPSPRFTVLKSDFPVSVNIINIIHVGQVLNPKIISTHNVKGVNLTYKILPCEVSRIYLSSPF